MPPDENDRMPDSRRLARLIGRRLREARLAAGYRTAREFSDEHDYPQASYIQHELGTRSQHKMLQQYADDLGVSVAWLTSESMPLIPAADRREVVRITGAVQAGIWQESVRWKEDDQRDVPLIRLDESAPLPRFALEVRGPSMNLVYPEGTILYCIPYGTDGASLENGRRVIVHRKRGDGLIEATAREVLIENGNIWLCPRSGDPRHQTPIEVGRDGVEEVIVVALVVGSYRPEIL